MTKEKIIAQFADKKLVLIKDLPSWIDGYIETCSTKAECEFRLMTGLAVGDWVIFRKKYYQVKNK